MRRLVAYIYPRLARCDIYYTTLAYLDPPIRSYLRLYPAIYIAASWEGGPMNAFMDDNEKIRTCLTFMTDDP